DVRERRAHDRADADVHRPDRQADGQRRHEKRNRDEPGPEADTPRLDAGSGLHPAGCGGRAQPSFAIRATVLANCTVRCPQRAATSSAAATRRWCSTAATVLQPGRSATVEYDCWQHFVSARTMICGSLAMMYSPESCGYPPEVPPAASAMSWKPNSL